MLATHLPSVRRLAEPIPVIRKGWVFSFVGHKSPIILVLVSLLAPLTLIPSSCLRLVTEESRLGATLAQPLPEAGVSQIPGKGFVLHPKAWLSLSFSVPETVGGKQPPYHFQPQSGLPSAIWLFKATSVLVK